MPLLRGLTWKHDRGLAPLLATAREFSTRRPGTAIQWEARSLHEFGDVSVESIAAHYDMIVIDHPFMGDVAERSFLIPFDAHLGADVLETLGRQSVGASHRTYFLGGHQWALAIDAASQVSGYRADLLRREGLRPPNTWDEVFELARVRKGFVTPALLPLDSMMCFLSLCANLGSPALHRAGDRAVDREAGEEALSQLKRLASYAHEEAFTWNPIAVWERMSSTDEIGYCPLAFGYSNYARDGYRRHLVTFANVPSAGFGPAGATLGGAGLAITRACKHADRAVEYAAWIAGADCQRTLYIESGGQPGNRIAWTAAAPNALTNGYFEAILPTVENAYVRPRGLNYVDFQTAAGKVVWNHIRGDGSAASALSQIDELFRSWYAGVRNHA